MGMPVDTLKVLRLLGRYTPSGAIRRVRSLFSMVAGGSTVWSAELDAALNALSIAF